MNPFADTPDKERTREIVKGGKFKEEVRWLKQTGMHDVGRENVDE
jgi:hypothetical protein